MKKKRQCAVGIQVWGPGDVMLHQNEVHGEERNYLQSLLPFWSHIVDLRNSVMKRVKMSLTELNEINVKIKKLHLASKDMN